MDKITFCIPSKNNLRYLKNSIRSIRENSTIPHDVIVYIDQDTDGTQDWLDAEQVPYIKNDSTTPNGIAYGYNRCIEQAQTEIVCMFHADMFMGKHFDTNLLKHLKNGVVVAGTRIEPPLHPQGEEKLIRNFGMYPEDFLEDQFMREVDELQQSPSCKDQITKGIFAPWICYKAEIVELGLHDEYLHSYYEDSDIFNRMLLNGMQCVQSRDAFVYHLTCRGGQFQDGIEQITTDEAFHKMKQRAASHYLRKWGSWVANDQYQHPIIHPKYNTAYVVHNCNLQILQALEPLCDNIYISDTVVREAYCSQEQPNSKFNLRDRVRTISFDDSEKPNNIVIEFDAYKLTNQNFQLLTQLPQIIQQSGEVGQFELDIFTITIKDLTQYQNNLIHIYN